MSGHNPGPATGLRSPTIASVPDAPLLHSVTARLRGAHDLVGRLEGIANRVFGPIPEPGAKDIGSDTQADTMNHTLNSLLDRLHSVTNRLEQIA